MNMLKQRYPQLYQRFGAAVKSGNIIIEGGMWVNLTPILPAERA